MSQKDITEKALIENGLANLKFAVNRVMSIEGHISLKDAASQQPPDHLPQEIEASFREGAACMSIGCYNAAATMFRLCIDLATRAMLPVGEVEGLNAKTRSDLGLRLPWLIGKGLLPQDLR